ncbi:MAG: formyltetrahydrofolate deformylase [Flavitalea sp.]
MENNHVLRIQCADRKGLIAGITDVLFKNDHNILVMKEYVEQERQRFFARFEFSGELKEQQLQPDLQSILPEDAIIRIVPRRKKDIVILVTKEHHCLSDLLIRFYFNELHANIKAVIGNHDILKPFVDKFDIPFHHISHEQPDFESEILQTIDLYKPDYLVLAKFMRILSPEFVSAFNERIINIHHSFLPAFIGANPYKKAFERGVKMIGATAHIVNNDLDEGPIIAQRTIPVGHDDDLRDMVEAGQEIEKSVLADALRMVLEDKVFVSGNKTIVFD